MRPERDALEIQFPRVEGYRVELPEERLTADFNAESILTLSPDLVGPSITRNSGIIGEGADNWGTLCPPLELLAADGKRRQTQCANAEGLFRIIQSIPSPKAGRAVEGRRAATRVRCFRSISSAIGSRPIGGQGVRSDLQDS